MQSWATHYFIPSPVVEECVPSTLRLTASHFLLFSLIQQRPRGPGILPGELCRTLAHTPHQPSCGWSLFVSRQRRLQCRPSCNTSHSTSPACPAARYSGVRVMWLIRLTAQETEKHHHSGSRAGSSRARRDGAGHMRKGTLLIPQFVAPTEPMMW